MNPPDEIRRESDRVLLQRLEGIERQLAEMREVLVQLARIDERMTNQKQANERIETQINNLYTRINALETAGAGSKVQVGWLERGAWAVLAGAIAVLFGSHGK